MDYSLIVPGCCIGIVLLGGIGYVVLTYNRLITLKNRVSNELLSHSQYGQ